MQDKNKKILSICTMVALLITSSTTAINVSAESAAPLEIPRLCGSDRYETALKISQAGWENGSDYAVIASGDGYSDALCAIPLAKASNAPILLTQNGALSKNTLSELKRLNVKHVFIVGGQQVVSKEAEDQIKSQITSDIQRLYGQNRFETSVKVAEKLGTTSKIVLASGDGYADALSVAPAAAIEGMPILLTESSNLSKSTAEYIKEHPEITKTYVIGGYASVSDSAMKSVPGAERIGGSNRYETNAAITNAFASDYNFDNIYVALAEGPSGNEFADALTGSVLAAKNKNPLIITGKELNTATAGLLKAKLKSTSTITVLGGVANVSDELAAAMKDTIKQSSISKISSVSDDGKHDGNNKGNVKVINVDPLAEGVEKSIDIPTGSSVDIESSLGTTLFTLEIPEDLGATLGGQIRVTAKTVGITNLGTTTDEFTGIDLELKDKSGKEISTPIPITLIAPGSGYTVNEDTVGALHYDGSAWTNIPISISGRKVTFTTTFSPVAVVKIKTESVTPTAADPTGSPIHISLNWASFSVDSYNVYRNDELIASGLKTQSYNDCGFVKGDNNYYVVGCNSKGLPVKKTKIFTKKVKDGSALTSLINDMVTVAQLYKVFTNNIDIKNKDGNVTIAMKDKSLKTKTISQLYAENFINKIKTTEYDAGAQAVFNNYISKISIDGMSVKTYLISKLQGKTHTQSVIDYLQKPSKTTYDALRSNLINKYDTYNELVDVLEEIFDITTDKKVPQVTVVGTSLKKILMDSDAGHNKVDSEIIVGNSYSIDDVKAMLGIKSAIGDATLSSLGGKYIGFQFSNGETIWVNFSK